MSAAPGEMWTNLRVAGADGTPLAVDVHLPPRVDWPVPVVVTRTPYGRSTHLTEGQGWAARGFGYVVQDVRGRYDSDGQWRPYRDERADGAALADWIIDQRWCDSQLVAYGGSYSGFTAWALAVERPDAVRAVVSLGPSMGLHRTKFEPSGVLRLAEHAYWWLERADGRTSRDGLVRLVHARQPDVLDHLPVCELPERMGASLPHWADLLHTGPEPGPEVLTDEELAGVRAAAFHVGGWYDLLVTETLTHWDLVGSAITPRPPRRMLVGAWGHDLAFAPTSRVGDRDHGPTSRYDFGTRCVDWLRAVLRPAPASSALPVVSPAASAPHAPTPPASQAPSGAEVFVRGADRWVACTEWPPTPATDTVWYAGADESLSVEDSGPAGGRSFRYDPADPFPSTVPGADRRPLLGRKDAVRFVSDPLPAPVTLLGSGRVELSAAADGPAADWIVRVLGWQVDGALFEIAFGSAVRTAPAGTSGAFAVTLAGAVEQLPTGARLVLEITGSDHPNLARNLGTGQDRYTTAATRPCTQTVLFEPARAGIRLVLSVMGLGVTAEIERDGKAGRDRTAGPAERAFGSGDDQLLAVTGAGEGPHP
ncbi:CocE/NonD family hydrolase [Frankia sp. R43]|uniref:CocE/NonD family hydrolase n=1 Tax=Frankia sp. R43 TaxID=269536 RepID=UPI0006C9F232|nr:CocE/NonD family hydrolase [Frankia sp. R43]